MVSTRPCWTRPHDDPGVYSLMSIKPSGRGIQLLPIRRMDAKEGKHRCAVVRMADIRLYRTSAFADAARSAVAVVAHRRCRC